MFSSPRRLALVLLLCSLVLFLALGAYQLHLPGLHYDEAKEAGVNAMQLVTWQPLTAFRNATVQFGPWRLPLMVQDYIGALNVLLAAPFLALGGINVVALRWLPLLTGALTLLLTWRVAGRLGGPVAATATAFLLAVNPSFVFWSRQGIFVTNLTALLFMASLLTGLRWWLDRRPRDLWLTAFLWGLGIYAKLLFVWAIGALVGVAAGMWGLRKWQMSKWVNTRGARRQRTFLEDGPVRPSNEHPERSGVLSLSKGGAQSKEAAARHIFSFRSKQERRTGESPAALTWAIALACFLLPLIPLILFNVSTGGTLSSIFGNLGHSYYGVDNSAYLSNLLVRLKQVVTLLRGDHFWYLGGVFANRWAPWLAGGLVIAAVLKTRKTKNPPPPHLVTSAPLLPVALLALIVAQSAFTVSDLFITHYALLLPLIPLTGGLAAGVLLRGMGGSEQKIEKAVNQRIPMGQDIGKSANQQIGKYPKGTMSASVATLSFSPLNFLLTILTLAALLGWGGYDLWTTVRYHQALTASGGHAAHSDAIYDLAGYLDRGGLSAPVALDWGIDAPVRFLTAGRVKPIEVFGYDRLDAPDAGFAGRVGPFVANPDNIYLAHVPDETIFRGRVEVLATLARAQGLALQEEARFAERDGRPLFVLYRVVGENVQ